jgi:hypothetical protein
MPKPAGWTEEMLRERDERVKAMLADTGFQARAGESREHRAYAIATAAIERERKAHGSE